MAGRARLRRCWPTRTRGSITTEQKPTEEKIVCVATKGKYSSYHICEVFEDKAVAAEFARQYSTSSYGGEVEIEEWTLNRAVPKIYRYSVILDANSGNVISEDGIDPELDPVDGFGGVACFWPPEKIRGYGADRDEAIKNAADFRREHLARQ